MRHFLIQNLNPPKNIKLISAVQVKIIFLLYTIPLNSSSLYITIIGTIGVDYNSEVHKTFSIPKVSILPPSIFLLNSRHKKSLHTFGNELSSPT